MDADDSDFPTSTSLVDRMRRHWLITALFIVGTIAGALLGAFQLPDDIALVRRVVGGAISGAGIAFLITATKMLN